MHGIVSMHMSMIVVERGATDTRQQKERDLSAAACTCLSFAGDDASVHERGFFLSCSVAGDGPADAILVMRHKRVCGDTPRKPQPLSSRKSH